MAEAADGRRIGTGRPRHHSGHQPVAEVDRSSGNEGTGRMRTVTLSYNPLLRPPKFTDHYPPELEFRMSPPIFATRMQAVNAMALQPQTLSREAQLRTVVFLSLVIVAIVVIEAAMLEAKSQGILPATWFLAFLAIALAALGGAFLLFAAQYQKRLRKVHKDISQLIEVFNATDTLVGVEWRLKQATECSGTWLHPNVPLRIVIQVSDGDVVEIVEVPRSDVELDPADRPPPPYSPSAAFTTVP